MAHDEQPDRLSAATEADGAPAGARVARPAATLDPSLAGRGEDDGEADAPRGADRGKHVPERTCILTRRTGARGELIRLAISPAGEVLPDVRARAPGRGAWIGVTRAELEQAQRKGKLKGALARAFKGRALSVPDDLGDRIGDALRRALLDRLGLEARAGMLLTGSDRIEDAARRGRVHLLLHAGDAGADGSRRLDQAWRVGRGEEGTGAGGLALPLDRTILAMALGRENVVHIAVVDRAAAGRVSDALSRWLGFVEDGGAGPRDGFAGPAPTSE